jgi:PhnB protein
VNVQPYLFFEGRAEEALNFYTKALGTKPDMIMRYRESPEPPPPGKVPPGSDDKVMHASFHVGDTEVMLSDGFCSGKSQFAGFSLSISAPDEATARRYFDAMSAGGNVTMPLGPTFWSPCFGMLTDRFGVGWMITVESKEARP